MGGVVHRRTCCRRLEGMTELFVPGRLCLMGEHTDWAAGYRKDNRGVQPGVTLVATTQEGLYARVEALAQARLKFSSVRGSTPEADRTLSMDVPLTVEALKGLIEESGFFSYVAGTALELCSQYSLFANSTRRPAARPQLPEQPEAPEPAPGGPKGLAVDNYRTTLPLKKGLSSSAAVCVLVAEAFDAAFGLGLPKREVMELAYRGEVRAGSNCGRMDQVCALGPNRVGAMFFDGEGVHIHCLTTPEPGLFMVVADLDRAKDTVQILKCLNRCFPHPQDATQEGMHRYVSANASLAWAAIRAIETVDAESLGRAMTEAQALFDELAAPNCPRELASPRLHEVMRDGRLLDLCWAIKGVGAQGDGSVQLLAKGPAEQREVIRLLKEIGLHRVFPLTVAGQDCPQEAEPCRDQLTTPPGAVVEGTPEDNKPPPPPVLPRALHAMRPRSAVMVAAGLSTRMFPASAVVKKELFPVVDHDGVCKPVALAIAEDLMESGIERIILVVQEKDIPVFDGFFSMEGVRAHKHRLKPWQKAYCDRIEALQKRITYAVQHQQEGFGHAVYCARRALGYREGGSKEEEEEEVGGGEQLEEEEAFLLVLGDHLYRRGAGTSSTCASQLIHAYMHHGRRLSPAIGLKVIPERSISPYGVAAGDCIGQAPSETRRRWAAAVARASGPGSGMIGANESPESMLGPGVAGMEEGPTVARAATGAGSAAEEATAQAEAVAGRVYHLRVLSEKPSVAFARENLITPDLLPCNGGYPDLQGRCPGGEGMAGPGGGEERRYLVVFGQYILPTRRTFDMLGRDIREDRRERGEFQLTSVLDRLREEDGGMLGYVTHGEALDMGIPQPYVDTMGRFSQAHVL